MELEANTSRSLPDRRFTQFYTMKIWKGTTIQFEIDTLLNATLAYENVSEPDQTREYVFWFKCFRLLISQEIST